MISLAPVTRYLTRFHTNQAWRQGHKELQNVCPPELPPNYLPIRGVDPPDLKDVVRQI
jgi:hypothetical protein